ncbi:hypothetical protein [Klebsiella sp. BIGb0407]|uniref:hypothetical protein n=1 Tax=Klebsiella sp. BIGb0407 TaxID=2940603 RepID=UPI0021682688|nr:hypothetical protein [Klebsiella sp. BIGb0407]MCS3434320.1 hypothetical protein [Klebsiella sp. BIGb0407]
MTAKTETENNGKTANNTFKIDCDRVKVTAFTLPLHQQRPGYSRGTAFAAAHTKLYLSLSRNRVEAAHEKRSVPRDILIENAGHLYPATVKFFFFHSLDNKLQVLQVKPDIRVVAVFCTLHRDIVLVFIE